MNLERLARWWRYRNTWRTPIGQDCISLDSALCKWLGERLSFLAEHCHGHPNGMTGVEWDDALRAHAAVLLAYPERWDADTVEQEDEFITAAQNSLRWVAEHLPTLWD